MSKSLSSHYSSDSERDDDEYESSSTSTTIDIQDLCFCLPCCMTEQESADLGRHVSIFMVSLIAFATFFCVITILILVFVLG